MGEINRLELSTGDKKILSFLHLAIVGLRTLQLFPKWNQFKRNFPRIPDSSGRFQYVHFLHIAPGDKNQKTQLTNIYMYVIMYI